MATGRKLTEQGEIRFYEWLENKIAEEGSANKFCEATGIRAADVSKYRKGNKAPTRYMVERMAASYNLSVEDIIGKDGIGADIIPRGDVTGLPKKKKEPEEPKPSEEAIPFSFIDAQIAKLQKEIDQRDEAISLLRQLKEGWKHHAD